MTKRDELEDEISSYLEDVRSTPPPPELSDRKARLLARIPDPLRRRSGEWDYDAALAESIQAYEERWKSKLEVALRQRDLAMRARQWDRIMSFAGHVVQAVVTAAILYFLHLSH